MGDAIVTGLIVIGAILLSVLQGVVLASLSKELEQSEQADRQPAKSKKKSIMAAISEEIRKIHIKEHRYKVS